MKTLIYRFILSLVIGISMISCDPEEYLVATEHITVRINNSTSHTLDIYYIDHNHPSWIYRPDTLHSLPFSINDFFGIGFLRKENVRNDIFVAISNKLIGKQLVVIDELSSDTLANWNDSSVVFNDRKYWTITAGETVKFDMDFWCTLNLTDEVLKLK